MLAQCLPLRRVCRPLALLAGLLSLSVLPTASVHAQNVSTDGKNSVMTVPVDAGIDAAFFFDGLTRDLTGFVLNNVGVPNIRYKISLDKVFTGPGGKSIKSPIYLFATGKVSIRTKGRTTYGGGAIYVTESKTGQMAVLLLPWNTAYKNQSNPYMQELKLHGKFPLRNVDMDE